MVTSMSRAAKGTVRLSSKSNLCSRIRFAAFVSIMTAKLTDELGTRVFAKGENSGSRLETQPSLHICSQAIPARESTSLLQVGLA